MVTVYSNIFSKEPHYITIEQALARIRAGKSKDNVSAIRSALDKERAIGEANSAKPEFKQYLQKKADIAKTDEQFLEIMKSLFSVFELQGANYVVNQEKFNTSLAKREIKKIIYQHFDIIVEEWNKYFKTK